MRSILLLGKKIWWQQNCAPTHSHRIVTEHLNNIFYERWRGKYGYIQWSPRSPDLTLLDFLWSYIKNIVYKIPPTSAEDMKNRIIDVCRSISQNISISMVENLKNGWGYVCKRMEVRLNILSMAKDMIDLRAEKI